jgi:hypothetical protein
MTDPELTAEAKARKAAKKRADDLRGVFTHLGAFIAVGVFFFIINFATDRQNWWFFYPMLPWGVGMAIHAWNVLWNDRIFGEDWTEKKVQEMMAAAKRTHTNPHAAKPQPATAAATATIDQGTEADDIIQKSGALIDRMRISARAIQKPEIRREALAISASADQVLSAIIDNPGEIAIARDFLNRYLTPATTIISDYSRLASRNIPSAQATLAKVETHDLPLLSRKLDDLYDRLHRGNLIDLEVAREMLSLDVADWSDSDSGIDEILRGNRTGQPDRSPS